MKRQVLFVHGGGEGAYEEDRKMAASLQPIGVIRSELDSLEAAPLQKARLAVLPNITHFVPPSFGVLDRAGWLVPMIGEFLDAPMAEAGGSATMARVR